MEYQWQCGTIRTKLRRNTEQELEEPLGRDDGSGEWLPKRIFMPEQNKLFNIQLLYTVTISILDGKEAQSQV